MTPMKTLLLLPLLLCLVLTNCTTPSQNTAQNLAAQFLKQAATEATVITAEAGLLVASAKLDEAESQLAAYRASLSIAPSAQEYAKLAAYERALAAARELHTKLSAQVAKLNDIPEVPAAELPEVVVTSK